MPSHDDYPTLISPGVPAAARGWGVGAPQMCGLQSRRSPGNYPDAECGGAGCKASIERGYLRGRLNPGRV